MSLRWLRAWWVFMVAVCAMHAGAASAGCVIVGLAGGMSLMSCTGGIGGTMFDLGNGLASYRLSNGVSGMFAIGQSSTGATALATPPAPPQPGPAAASPAVAVPAGLTVTPGASVTFLIKGATKSPTGTAPSGVSAGPASTINLPINAPLTPGITNLASTGLAAPASKPAKPATGTAGTPPVMVNAPPAPPNPANLPVPANMQ